jgi:hypothetical protein
VTKRAFVAIDGIRMNKLSKVAGSGFVTGPLVPGVLVLMSFPALASFPSGIVAELRGLEVDS